MTATVIYTTTNGTHWKFLTTMCPKLNTKKDYVISKCTLLKMIDCDATEILKMTKNHPLNKKNTMHEAF